MQVYVKQKIKIYLSIPIVACIRQLYHLFSCMNCDTLFGLSIHTLLDQGYIPTKSTRMDENYSCYVQKNEFVFCNLKRKAYFVLFLV